MDQFSLPYGHPHYQVLVIFGLLIPVLVQIEQKKKIISMCHIKEKRWKSGKHPDIAVSQLNIAL